MADLSKVFEVEIITPDRVFHKVALTNLRYTILILLPYPAIPYIHPISETLP